MPNFIKGEPPLNYSTGRVTWETLLELIKSRSRQQVFWDFVETLRQVRLTYNKIIQAKFRLLSRALKRNSEIQNLFNQNTVNADKPYASNSDTLSPKAGSEAKEATNTREEKISDDYISKVTQNHTGMQKMTEGPGAMRETVSMLKAQTSMISLTSHRRPLNTLGKENADQKSLLSMDGPFKFDITS